MQPSEISEMLRKMSECRLEARDAVQALQALLAGGSPAADEQNLNEQNLNERPPPYNLTKEELQDVTGRC